MSKGLDSYKHQVAIELRLMGFTYAQIASNPQIALKENTIRAWFMKGGICNQHYKELQKKRHREYEHIFNRIHLQIRLIAIDAVRVLGEAVKQGDLRASFKALDIVDIRRYLIQQQAKYEDEGIMLLRKIILHIREETKKAREMSSKTQ